MVVHTALRPLQPGTEGLFFLSRRGGKMWIAMDYFGVFAVVDGVVVPPKQGGLRRNHSGRSVQDFMAELVAIAKQRK